MSGRALNVNGNMLVITLLLSSVELEGDLDRSVQGQLVRARVHSVSPDLPSQVAANADRVDAHEGQRVPQVGSQGAPATSAESMRPAVSSQVPTRRSSS